MSNYFQFPLHKWTEIFPSEVNQRLQIFYGGREPNDSFTQELFQRNSGNLDKFIADQRYRYNLSGINYQGGQAQFPEFTVKYINNYGQERIHIDPIVERPKGKIKEEIQEYRDIMNDGYIAVIINTPYDNYVDGEAPFITPGNGNGSNPTYVGFEFTTYGYITYTKAGTVLVDVLHTIEGVGTETIYEREYQGVETDGIILSLGPTFRAGTPGSNPGGTAPMADKTTHPDTSSITIRPAHIDTVKISLNGSTLVDFTPEPISTTILLFRFGENACKCPSYRDDMNPFKNELLGACLPPRQDNDEDGTEFEKPENHKFREVLPAYHIFDDKFLHGLMQNIFNSTLSNVELKDMGVYPVDMILDGENIVEITGTLTDPDDDTIVRSHVTACAEFFSRDPTTFRKVFTSWNMSNDNFKSDEPNFTVNDKPLYFWLGAQKISRESPQVLAADAQDTIDHMEGDTHPNRYERNGITTAIALGGFVDETNCYMFSDVGVDEVTTATFKFDLSKDNPPNSIDLDTDSDNSFLGPLVILRDEPEEGKWNYTPHVSYLTDSEDLDEQENGIKDWLLFVRSLLPFWWPVGPEAPLTDQEEEMWLKE